MSASVVARCDAPEVFEFVEESFDEVALAIEFAIDRTLVLAITLGGNVRPPATTGHQIDQVLPVVAAVGNMPAVPRAVPEPLPCRRHDRLSAAA